MTTVFVQFYDDTRTIVVAAFASAQDPEAYPNQEEIEDTDPRYLSFLNPAATLEGAQSEQIALIEAGYQAAIQRPVSYLGTTFQADDASQLVLAKCLVAGSVPDGMFWLDAENNQVPMDFAALQGLAGAMLEQGQAAFAKKTTLKEQIRAATTVGEVKAIVWD